MYNSITHVIQTRIDNGHLIELDFFTKQATIIYKESAAPPYTLEISNDDMLTLIFENSQYLKFNREICIIKKKAKGN